MLNYVAAPPAFFQPTTPINQTLVERVRALAGEASQIEIAAGLLIIGIENLDTDDRPVPLDIVEAGYTLRNAAVDLCELLLSFLETGDPASAVRASQETGFDPVALARMSSPEFLASAAPLDAALEEIAEEQEALDTRRDAVEAQLIALVVGCGFGTEATS